MLSHLSRKVSELERFWPSELIQVFNETVVSFYNHLNTNAFY